MHVIVLVRFDDLIFQLGSLTFPQLKFYASGSACFCSPFGVLASGFIVVGEEPDQDRNGSFEGGDFLL